MSRKTATNQSKLSMAKTQSDFLTEANKESAEGVL